MDAKEVVTLEQLKLEIIGAVNKTTAVKARNVYNAYHEKVDHITDCMCSRIRRKILGSVILEWYEG